MTGNDALEELLGRLAASYDGSVFFFAAELRRWPKAAVSAFNKAGLLTQATPANSTTCDGCEQQCHMPVEVVRRAGRSAAFVMCDKRHDIARVEVPLERLDRWQASGEAMATALANVLGIHRPLNAVTQTKRWDLGRLRSKRVEPVVLTIVDALTLEVAGHSLPLVEMLSLKAGRLEIDRRRLVDHVDHPKAGGRASETGEQRALRIAARCEELRANGHRNFRKIVAIEEGGFGVETIKSLLAKAKKLASTSNAKKS